MAPIFPSSPPLLYPSSYFLSSNWWKKRGREKKNPPDGRRRDRAGKPQCDRCDLFWRKLNMKERSTSAKSCLLKTKKNNVGISGYAGNCNSAFWLFQAQPQSHRTSLIWINKILMVLISFEYDENEKCLAQSEVKWNSTGDIQAAALMEEVHIFYLIKSRYYATAPTLNPF